MPPVPVAAIMMATIVVTIAVAIVEVVDRPLIVMAVGRTPVVVVVDPLRFAVVVVMMVIAGTIVVVVVHRGREAEPDVQIDAARRGATREQRQTQQADDGENLVLHGTAPPEDERKLDLLP